MADPELDRQRQLVDQFAGRGLRAWAPTMRSLAVTIINSPSVCAIGPCTIVVRPARGDTP